ncbi:MAG: L-rhamnose/proton symporter RhaT, partial [Sphingobacteriales bacterium]
IVYVFGVLWGIGGLTYGLGVRFLGVSLGSSIILGLCMIFGALIPAIFYDFKPTPDKDTFSQMLATDWGRIVLMGLVVCIVGIIVSGKAGMMKEKELSADASKNTSSEYKFTLGMIVAVVSGVLSACFNFGLEGGQIMATMANDIWKAANPDQGEFLFRNNVVYVVLLWGGLTTNFIWCMILNARNKSFGNYIDKQTPLIKNYVFSALAGTTWFLQFFFYGMGESKLGNGPSSWILHMAFIILIANLWGLVLNEWKMVNKKTRNTMVTGIAIIIISILIVGYGNNLHK